MVNIPRTSEEARAAIAAELRAVTEGARESSPSPAATLPPARPVTAPSPVPPPASHPDVPASARRPDNGPVNELWNAPTAAAPGGLRGLVFRLLRPVLAPVVDTQVAFNSRQVQLDNQLLEYIEARLDETHRHYDRVLGQYGQHIADANERHLLLQRELVTHVHDLVRRIDLVLSEGERGRLSLDTSLRDLRARIIALEERVRR